MKDALATFSPQSREVREFRDEHGISAHDAKQILLGESLRDALATARKEQDVAGLFDIVQALIETRFPARASNLRKHGTEPEGVKVNSK